MSGYKITGVKSVMQGITRRGLSAGFFAASMAPVLGRAKAPMIGHKIKHLSYSDQG